MKEIELVIKVPEVFYEQTKEYVKNNEIDADNVLYAIANGTPLPEDATNGDVIKVMFPTFHTDELSHTVWVGYDQMSFKRDWWNAKYKAESEE